MNLEQFYQNRRGDYPSMIKRFKQEERLMRYLYRVEEDCALPSVEEALRQGRTGEAFRLAHSLKGACLNLGLSDLLECAATLTEQLRPFSEGSRILRHEEEQEVWEELKEAEEVYGKILEDLHNLEKRG